MAKERQVGDNHTGEQTNQLHRSSLLHADKVLTGKNIVFNKYKLEMRRVTAAKEKYVKVEALWRHRL